MTHLARSRSLLRRTPCERSRSCRQASVQARRFRFRALVVVSAAVGCLPAALPVAPAQAAIPNHATIPNYAAVAAQLAAPAQAASGAAASAQAAAAPAAVPVAAVPLGRSVAVPAARAAAVPAAPVAAMPVARAAAVPTGGDAVRDEQWQLDWLRAGDAWRQADGAGVTVAVLDSGVDASHPDLAGQVLPGIDLVDGSTDGRSDPVGHGTTVAALIAGRNDDQRGVVGLAPKVKILPVRVLNKDNRYDDATVVADGVRWAVDHGAKVVNLSLGGTGSSEALAEALDYAFAKDVVVVACTGNITPPAPDEVWYPAREPGVLAVTGLTRDDNDEPLWSSSLTGPQTVLAAPAADLLGARPGGYARVQGTSFAAPLVAATAALVRSHWPQMSAPNVVNRLTTTARDLGSPGRDDKYGFGAVNPVGALSAGIPEVASNPLDTAAPHGVSGFGPAPGVVDDASGPPATSASATGPAPDGPANAGGGAKRAALAPQDASSPMPGLLGGLAVCLVLVGMAVLAARRFDRH